MSNVEFERYRDEFYPSGFRKIFAMLLVTSVVVLPELNAWRDSPAQRPSPMGMPSGRFRPSGGFLSEYSEPRPSLFQSVWSSIKRGFVTIVAIVGVMLYYPRTGFKRYALLVGPVFAFLVPVCVRLYLQDRTEVYSTEIVLVSLVAFLPGIALYAFLTWRKAQRLGMDW